MSVLDRKELEQSPLADLHAIASELGVEGYRRLRKEELIAALMEGQDDDDGVSRDEQADAAPDVEAEAEPSDEGELDQEEEPGDEDEDEEAEEDEPEEEAEPEVEDIRSGVLDILPNGSGFMRPDPFAHSRDDVYVSPAQIRRCELRAGDAITGPVRPPRRSERYPSLVRVDDGQRRESRATRRTRPLRAPHARVRLGPPTRSRGPRRRALRQGLARGDRRAPRRRRHHDAAPDRRHAGGRLSRTSRRSSCSRASVPRRSPSGVATPA